MSHRQKILAAIQQSLPSGQPLPEPVSSGPKIPSEDLKAHFCQRLESVGGSWYEWDSEENVRKHLTESYPQEKLILSHTDRISFGRKLDTGTTKTGHTYQDTGLYLMDGQLGVAENAAIWVAEAQMGHRALPFLTQHLVIFLPTHQIVSDLHMAYDQIELLRPGFGLFISGPSKTADIEQSLVKGAHGPRSLKVILV